MKQVVFRQFISSLFVMLAFGVLTTHEVIPHHHHADHICLEQKACDSDHSHESEPPDHQGEGCALQKIPVVASNNHSLKITALFLLHDDTTTYDHHGILNAYTCNILLLTPLPFRQTPFNSFPAPLFAGCVTGLRAPPVA